MGQQEREPLQPLSDSQREMIEEAVATYEAARGEVAEHLAARGITEAVAATFRLGVVADPLPGHANFKGMICIPYLDRKSKALTMRFRCPVEHDHRASGHGKYMSLPHDPPRPFNVRAIHEAVDARSDELHITEGEFDAMVLNALGLHAIAIPGASLWQPSWRRMVAGFSRVWVWGDPDEAGAEFGRKLTQSMSRAKVVNLKGGDVSEVFQREGAGALISLVAPGF